MRKTHSEDGEAIVLQHTGPQLLRFSLRFDPYSRTAEEDYARLKSEIKKFDIIGLLKEELSKSRVHIALARKIVAAIRYLEHPIRDDAVLSILNNFDVLYPIFSSVLVMLDAVFDELQPATQALVVANLQKLIKEESHIFRVEVHLSYAVRVLAHSSTPENHLLLQEIYKTRDSPLIRRDVILVLASWGEWYWISDLRNRFRELSGPERRAFIVSSYILRDEGDHWRRHIKAELNPFETFIIKWAGEKAGQGNWRIPL